MEHNIYEVEVSRVLLVEAEHEEDATAKVMKYLLDHPERFGIMIEYVNSFDDLKD